MLAQACKSESFFYSFGCRANQGRDIAPLSFEHGYQCEVRDFAYLFGTIIMHLGRKLTVLWDERELGNSVMLFTCSSCRCCPSQCALPTQCPMGHLVWDYYFTLAATNHNIIIVMAFVI